MLTTPADSSGNKLVNWTPYGSPPRGLRLENLRKANINVVRISIEPDGWSGSLLGKLGSSRREPPWTLTLQSGELKISTPKQGMFSKASETRITFPDVENIIIKGEGGIGSKSLEISTKSDKVDLAKGLSVEALEWLKNYLVMEIAGLTWRPVAKNGRFNLHNEIQYATNTVLLKPDLAVRLIDIFLGEAPEVMAKLRSAVEASDSTEIRRQAHWLKSASANVGARHLSELSQLLETYAVKKDASRNKLLLGEVEQKLPGVESWLEDVKKNASVAIARSKKFQETDKQDAKTSAKHPKNAPEANPQLIDAKVLVVDDSLVSREVASEFLGDLVTNVVFAKDGSEALEKWNSETYNVILMDCEMEPMSGIEATQEIRRQESDRDKSRTPIIALTGNILEDQQDEALAAGMDDYITKPYTPEGLEKVLTKWLGVEHSVTALKDVSKKMRKTVFNSAEDNDKIVFKSTTVSKDDEAKTETEVKADVDPNADVEAADTAADDVDLKDKGEDKRADTCDSEKAETPNDADVSDNSNSDEKDDDCSEDEPQKVSA